MQIMTHSIFIHLIAVLVASLVAAAILWGEHYHPWVAPLDQRLNYVLGTLAMLTPYSLLLCFWLIVPPGTVITFGLFALFGLWVIVAVSGATVHALYEADAKRAALERANAAEVAERLARNEPA